MNESSLTPNDCWRGIILLGLNTATYKLALAKCLIGFVEEGKDFISNEELATAFFDIYLQRLENQKPQLLLANRLTVMERVISEFKIERITRDEAIYRVQNEAFSDVIPRFHTVDNSPVPLSFYEVTQKGLVITDNAFAVLKPSQSSGLLREIHTRWDLLEAAFEMKRNNFELENDIRIFYLQNGYERTSVTKLRPALMGYQQNLCFYCNQPMVENGIAVDHVIPRQILQHDDVWNLVLVHEFCNMQKSDFLPSMLYIEQLIFRNEFLIKSNHPLKDKIIDKLGTTSVERRNMTLQVYRHAESITPPWEGVRGYNPRIDPLYHRFVNR